MPDKPLTPSAQKILEDRSEDGFLYCNSGGLKGGPAIQVRKGLLNSGHIERTPARAFGNTFQDDKDGPQYSLRITESGLAAIGAGAPTAATIAPKPAATAATAQPAKGRTPRADSKQARMITALRTPEGKTVAELQHDFGWQPHTVRAAISGLGKKDPALKPTSAKEGERGRVYRIA